MHDSAVAIVQPRSRSVSATRSSTVRPSGEYSVEPCSSASAAAKASYALCALGPKRVTTSSSPSRRHVVISRSARSSPRIVAASWDSGTPHSRMVSCRSSTAPRSASCTTGVASASGHIGCSSLGGPGSTTTGGPLRPSADRHDEPRRRTHRLEHRGAVGHLGLLAHPGGGRLGIGAPAAPGRQCLDARGDPRLQLGVERRRSPLGVGDDLRRQVVGRRPEAARGDDEVEPGRGEELQRAAQVLGPVADHDHVRDVDAAQPRAARPATARCGR